jgi:indolepyruvate ferredoxin oxidoreductase beta subunit
MQLAPLRTVNYKMEFKKDILMVGVGGQGIILASDIVGEVALTAGYEVKKTDTLGMAQRGGSVTSHLRIGDRVFSPLIIEGEADILLAFEKLEAARWHYFVKSDGQVIINNQSIPPLSVSLGTQKYPTDGEIKDLFKNNSTSLYIVDGRTIARELGDIRAANIFMLGCISAFLPMDFNLWKECISNRLPSKIVQVNLDAFEKGKERILNVDIK